MSDQLTTADIEREFAATPSVSSPVDENRAAAIAQLRRVHGHAVDRLIEKAPTPIRDRVALAKEAFTAALDLQGHQAISEEEFENTKLLYTAMMAEQKASATLPE